MKSKTEREAYLARTILHCVHVMRTMALRLETPGKEDFGGWEDAAARLHTEAEIARKALDRKIP